MSTFVLKKYEDKPVEVTNQPNEGTTEQPNQPAVKEKEEVTITISGTISEIVANALYKTLDKKADIKELQEGGEDNSPEESVNMSGTAVATESVVVITTEEINKDPVAAFRSVKEGDVVMIDVGNFEEFKGFSSKPEDWFLYNAEKRAKAIVYSTEALSDHLLRTLEGE